MDAIQRLRARARATGALTSTAQQKLVLDGDDIEIVPAQPDVIYVPYYDPELVYVAQPGYYDGPYLTFGVGFPIGFWLSYDFNWRTHVVLIGDRHHNWQEHRDWDRHGSGSSNNGNWHRWQPPVNRPPFTPLDTHRSHPGVVTPRPMPGAPPRPHDARPNDHGPRPETRAPNTDHNRPPVPVTTNPAPKPETRQDRTNRPSPPRAPRPEVKLPPPTAPRPIEPQHPVPPVTNRPDHREVPVPTAQPTRPDHREQPVPVAQPATRPDHRDGPMPVREPPARPESRPDRVPPVRVVNPPPRPVNPPPPPPATNTRDGTRDKDNEAQH